MAYAQRSWFGLQPQCWAAEVTAINCHHSKPPVSRELVQHQKQRLSHQKPWFKAVRVPQRRFSLIGLVWLHNQAARCSVIGQGAVSHTIQSLTPAPPGRVTAKTTTTVTTLWPHSKPGGRKCGKPHCSHFAVSETMLVADICHANMANMQNMLRILQNVPFSRHPLSLGNRGTSNLSKAFYLLTVHQPIALATFLSSKSISRSEREQKGNRMQQARELTWTFKNNQQNAPQSTISYAMAPLPPLDACHKGD